MKWPWAMAISGSLLALICTPINCRASFIQLAFDVKTQSQRQLSPMLQSDNVEHRSTSRPKRSHVNFGAPNGSFLVARQCDSKVANCTYPTMAPLELASPPQTVLTNVRGIYVSRQTFIGPRLNSLVRFVKIHGMNAMVVDVKDDNGVVSLDQTFSRNVKLLRQQHLYLIARIVTFKDPYLARRKPALAIHSTHGGIWTQNGVPWVDPYRAEVWNYNVTIAKRAIDVGFNEIQWDYVRFPDVPEQKRRSAVFVNPGGLSRSDDISAFLQFARRQLGHTPMSADVFGLVTSVTDDMGIGQRWEKIAPYVDVISPMMYPSHYGPGIYGLRYPERSPHLTVEKGLQDALMRNRNLKLRGIHTPVVRPWLQDFDMRVPYGRREVNEQVHAAAEQGVSSYLLWNQGNNYTG